MIPDLIPGQVVFVGGPFASGKTFLLQRWFERMTHVLLFDSAGDHIDNPGAEHIWGSPKALAERLNGEHTQDGYRIVYHPNADIQEGFDWAMSAIWQRPEPRWFILEEVHELMNPWNQHPKMKTLNKYARKAGSLGVIGSTQRLADVHKDFTSAARMSVLFHSEEANDLRAIGDRWGTDVEDAVRGLRPLQYSDADEVVSQTPQAVLTRRGQGHEIIEVG
jgi:hypothetical protein